MHPPFSVRYILVTVVWSNNITVSLFVWCLKRLWFYRKWRGWWPVKIHLPYWLHPCARGKNSGSVSQDIWLCAVLSCRRGGFFIDGFQSSAWTGESFWCVLWARLLIKDFPLALWRWRFYSSCTAIKEQSQSLYHLVSMGYVKLCLFFSCPQGLPSPLKPPHGLSETWRLWG